MKTLQAEDEIAACGIAIGAAFAGALGVTGTSGPGRRPEVRGDGPRDQPRAAAAHRRRAARRPVDRPAHQDRAGRPDARDVRPPRRGADADRRGAVRRSHCFDAAFEAVAHRREVPHAGDPADRRLPRQRRGAVVAPRRRRAARHLGAVRDRAEPRRRVLALPPRSRDAGASVGDSGHARPRAPHRRHREGGRHRQHQLRRPTTTSKWCACAPRRSPASPTTSRSPMLDDDGGGELLVLGWGSTWGAITAGVAPGARPRQEGRRTRTSRTSTRSRATSATCCTATRKVLVPEMNLGQLASWSGPSSSSTRRRYTQDGRVPFRAAEMEAKILEMCSMTTTRNGVGALTRKDFESDQEVRWCPGCGDYGILAAIQFLLPELGVKPDEMVFVSGIGCAARLPYYMNTYGMHSIHGRAPAVATGVALGPPRPARVGHRRRRRHAVDRWQPPDPRAAPQREPQDPDVQQPDLRADEGPVLADVGDRQGHEVDAVRLASTTRSTRSRSRSGPRPSFVARTHDIDRKHMMEMFRRAHEHQRRGLRRGVPELQRLQRRRVRQHPQARRARRHADRPQARRADQLRRPTASSA